MQSLRGTPAGSAHRHRRASSTSSSKSSSRSAKSAKSAKLQVTVQEFEDGSLKYNGNGQQKDDSIQEIRVKQGDAGKLPRCPPNVESLTSTIGHKHLTRTRLQLS